jgi:hypothetical protein
LVTLLEEKNAVFSGPAPDPNRAHDPAMTRELEDYDQDREQEQE